MASLKVEAKGTRGWGLGSGETDEVLSSDSRLEASGLDSVRSSEAGARGSGLAAGALDAVSDNVSKSPFAKSKSTGGKSDSGDWNSGRGGSGRNDLASVSSSARSGSSRL